jgi:hypothetical protein
VCRFYHRGGILRSLHNVSHTNLTFLWGLLERTEFDHEHSVALALIWGKNNDAGKIIVIIRYFLLQAE